MMKFIWLSHLFTGLSFLPLITIMFSCVNVNVSKDQPVASIQLPLHYNWQQPDTTFYLPLQLVEISGLAYHPQKEVLLTVQDEYGKYYEVHPETGKILAEQSFAFKGDFEGIAYSDDILYALESNGTIFSIQNEEVSKIKTILKSKNDTEGICLSSDSSSLLIACKGVPLESDKSKKTKAIYSWNISTATLDDDPFLTIEDEGLIDFFKNNYRENLSKTEWKKAKNRIKAFSPSAIAIHPLNQNIYILSAKGSLLVVLDNNKNLQSIVLLDNKRNPQPEGICFDNDGTAYISTEGQGLLGKIFVFQRHDTLN